MEAARVGLIGENRPPNRAPVASNASYLNRAVANPWVNPVPVDLDFLEPPYFVRRKRKPHAPRVLRGRVVPAFVSTRRLDQPQQWRLKAERTQRQPRRQK